VLNGLSETLARVQEIKTRFEAPLLKGGNFSTVMEKVRQGDVKAISGIGVDEKVPTNALFTDEISKAAKKYDLDPAFIKAVISAESGFNPNAKSHAGAMGLMQLMPGTARGLGVTDSFNPAQNVDGGCKYLRIQLDRFGDVKLALAAYNAGPGNVNKYGGVPPFAETQKYVEKVLAKWDDYKRINEGT